jgi:hypothetical protein
MPISSGEPTLRSDGFVATLLRLLNISVTRSQLCVKTPEAAPGIDPGCEQLFTHLALVGHYCTLISRATRGNQ